MGGFYGSFHFRNTDREELLTELRARTKRYDEQFLVTPERNGWISVFPSGSGQNPAPAGEINAKVPGDVLAVLSHDEDIMCYFLWRNGTLCDRFSSKHLPPGENPLGPEFSDSGNAKAFKDMLTPQQYRGIKSFFRWNYLWYFFPFLSSIYLHRLGTAIQIPDIVESYEYLNEDPEFLETDISSFIHIPEIPKRT
jgi:hypothetical protein